ncbi:MAG TPA: 1-(5-phosphoribosyl)-5-[(5-phosphoribosylamino)methylideneamino]imidazole-4-carboxamide isomerase [Candidatus Omnitrophota bacterium]|nr:1-(5-phosphoribosyl)-5-[(5-phosphoribosylamino)methylideneamino]imidazole-4-carboxamide isomerase [Candidatus Omnitrophota bacterium]
MIIIPAIDLKDGKCVRLAQGDFKRVTIYSDNPVEVGKLWQANGAQRLHLVDLDGSLAGSPRNKEAIRDIVQALQIRVEVGGGIRDMETIKSYMDLGVRWVILGTAAIRHPSLLKEACGAYRGRIILGIDAADGNVAVQGWTEKTSVSAVELAKSYEGYGLDAIVYTDIQRDGMETGVNVKKTQELAEAVSIPVIASGGVKGIDHVDRLLAVEGSGIMGVIIGKALYTGAITLKDAVERAQ